MANLSGDIPGTVPYFRGHIARRMADGSTRFFQWGAGRETTAAQNYCQYCFNRKFEQCIHPSWPSSNEPVYQLSRVIE